ncbi:MAG: hypothetical protein JW954_05115 [Dehalococcoidaceae bacterium]|nr:hypothetical protein [Dehalococcoidaceae bacterium]
MLYLNAIEIDDHILEKIESKHGVMLAEVEEICMSEKNHVRKGRQGLYKVFGQTQAGRYILAVLVNKSDGVWKVATAREMTKDEKRLYKS